MIIVNKYTCPIHKNVKFSIHFFKRGIYQNSIERLNEKNFQTLKDSIFKKEKLVYLFEVKSIQALSCKQVDISKF